MCEGKVFKEQVCVKHMGKEFVTREIKLEILRKGVEKCSDESLPTSKEYLIIHCSQAWGMRRQSAQELIRELEGIDAVHCDGNEVWSYERWEKIKEAQSRDYSKMKDILTGSFQKTL